MPLPKNYRTYSPTSVPVSPPKFHLGDKVLFKEEYWTIVNVDVIPVWMLNQTKYSISYNGEELHGILETELSLVPVPIKAFQGTVSGILTF
jgi:hypothetical protein